MFVSPIPSGTTKGYTYDICIADGLLTTFLLGTKAGAKAEAEARKKAEATAVNFILVSIYGINRSRGAKREERCAS